MPSKEDIICFSSIDWGFIWQGHQQIMQTLASQGHRVLYVENTGIRSPKIKDMGRLKHRIENFRKGVYGIRRIHPNLYIYSPLLLPFPYSRGALAINSIIFWNSLKRWLKALSFHKPIVWTFIPTRLTQKMVKKIDPKLLIYYCIDNLSKSSKSAKKIKGDEIALLKKADLVFATSHRLIDYCSEYHSNVSFFPFGVDLTHYLGKTFSTPPIDLADIPSPRIVYIGGIHRWIDFRLVKELLKKLPDINFVFIGPIQTDVSDLKGFKNLHFIPQKSQEELSHYLFYADLCLIPYRITPYTQSVYPTKLNEYLIMGKKVISTPIQEILLFNQNHDNVVSVADTAEEFVVMIRDELGGKISFSPKFVEIAKTNSWERRIESMLSLIDQKLLEKSEAVEKNWSHRIKILYHAITRKIALASACLILGYATFFYSKVPYYIAQPLKIEDRLAAADAVLALGGGVGESGLVGQGYQERVKTAVSLYQQGFVKKIIFSSGYVYLMKEAQVMKNLALAMGVPETDIFVEDRSGNTYESIKYFSKFIRREGLKKVIIVSSPYHMKRARLVAEKYFPSDVSFLLKPVESSLFFDSLSHHANLQQLKAIFHEYAAIAYYKFKKWI